MWLPSQIIREVDSFAELASHHTEHKSSAHSTSHTTTPVELHSKFVKIATVKEVM